MGTLKVPEDARLLTRGTDMEDAAVMVFPPGKALVQTVDFFTPIVNDPYKFGRIAAANSFSDVYAMGGEPVAAMNIVCFPVGKLPSDMLAKTLQGGLDAMVEAGAALAGGHSVEDDEFKYGLAVSGAVDPDGFSSNRGLRPGDELILTKPLGTGVLATALKGKIGDVSELEDLLYKWAGRLNKNGGAVIRELGLKGATDVTGFGLGGHVIEMARASEVRVELVLESIPFIDKAVELAAMGMIPAGSFANKKYCSKVVGGADGLDPIKADLVFDAQTSGGLVLAVPEDKVARAVAMLEASGEPAARIGRVLPVQPGEPFLYLS